MSPRLTKPSPSARRSRSLATERRRAARCGEGKRRPGDPSGLRVSRRERGVARRVEVTGLGGRAPTRHDRDDGDKDGARQIAVRAEVPVVPGSRRFEMGELDGLEDAAALVGYPLLVKAAGGGGGIGMRLVDAPAMLREIANGTQALAQRSFADGTVFLECYVAQARHVEVQVFGFGDGRAVHLFERECSIQRRFQKILEESPSPGISTVLRSQDHGGRGAARRDC